MATSNRSPHNRSNAANAPVGTFAMPHKQQPFSRWLSSKNDLLKNAQVNQSWEPKVPLPLIRPYFLGGVALGGVP